MVGKIIEEWDEDEYFVELMKKEGWVFEANNEFILMLQKNNK
jgi:hypothetical protein